MLPWPRCANYNYIGTIVVGCRCRTVLLSSGWYYRSIVSEEQLATIDKVVASAKAGVEHGETQMVVAAGKKNNPKPA